MIEKSVCFYWSNMAARPSSLFLITGPCGRFYIVKESVCECTSTTSDCTSLLPSYFDLHLVLIQCRYWHFLWTFLCSEQESFHVSFPPMNQHRNCYWNLCISVSSLGGSATIPWQLRTLQTANAGPSRIAHGQHD